MHVMNAQNEEIIYRMPLQHLSDFELVPLLLVVIWRQHCQYSEYLSLTL